MSERPIGAGKPNPIARFVAALVVVIVATTLSGVASSFFYNVLTASYGNNSEQANQWAVPIFVILWGLLMFIGFRISQRILLRNA